jgi:hypothetical protein
MGNIQKTMENHHVLWVNQRMGKLKLDFREYINGFWKNQQETCRVLPGREGVLFYWKKNAILEVW